MDKEYTIQPKTLPQLVKLLSGYFSLTKREAQVLSAIIHTMREVKIAKVDKNVKKEIANISNFGYQVVTNYVNTLKSKGAIKSDNTLHPILTKDKIVISYEDTM